MTDQSLQRIAVKLVQEVHVALSPWCQFEGERKVLIGLQALSAAPRGPSSQRAPSSFTWHQALGDPRQRKPH